MLWYLFMEPWMQIHASLIGYQYIDWTITVLMQMVKFYLILSAVNPNINAICSGFFFTELLQCCV